MNKTTKADTVLLLVTVLAASGWLFTKLGISGFPPMGFMALRFLAASLLVVPFTYKLLLNLTARQWSLAIRIGLFQGVGLLIWSIALDKSSELSEGAFISSTLVLMVPVWGRLFFAKRIARDTLMALPVALTGLAMLALNGSWSYEPTQVMFLVSAALLAMHLNLLTYFGREVPALPSTCIQLAMVGLCCLAGSLLFESYPSKIPADTWLWLAAAVLIATSLRYFLLTWGFKHSTSGHAAIIMILEPVWTSLMSVIWLGEILTQRKLAGCAFIFLALLITRRQQVMKIIKPATKVSTVPMEKLS
ncbi:MAG: DMT family transporter [Endozoicomonas sp.]